MYLDEKENIVVWEPYDEAICILYNNIEIKVNNLIEQYKYQIFNKKVMEVRMCQEAQYLLQEQLRETITISDTGNKNKNIQIRYVLPELFLKQLENIVVSITLDDYCKAVCYISYLEILKKEKERIISIRDKLHEQQRKIEISKYPYDILYNYKYFHGEQFIKHPDDLEELNSAISLLKKEVNDTYYDNIRAFPIEMEKEYICIRLEGCGEFADGILKCSSENIYRYGFNYGH